MHHDFVIFVENYFIFYNQFSLKAELKLPQEITTKCQTESVKHRQRKLRKLQQARQHGINFRFPERVAALHVQTCEIRIEQSK